MNYKASASSSCGATCAPLPLIPSIHRQRLEEFDQVAFVLLCQPEAEAAVMVIHDIQQRWEAAIVVKPALRMRPESV